MSAVFFTLAFVWSIIATWLWLVEGSRHRSTEAYRKQWRDLAAGRQETICDLRRVLALSRTELTSVKAQLREMADTIDMPE